MRIHVSRRRLLQLAAAPAFLSRERADAGARTSARRRHGSMPASMAGSSTSLTNRATPSTTPPTPDTAAAAWRFRRCRSGRRCGRSPATTPRTFRPPSTECRPGCRMPADSAAPCSSGPVTTAWPRHCASGRAAWCCAAKAWATPAPSSSARGAARPPLVLVGGASGIATKDDTRQTVTDDYVPVGARSFRVASAAGFRRGDTVVVRRIGNQAWIDAIGMNGDTPASRWRPFNIEWDRVVADVQGNTITVDAPITCAIEKRWGGGEVVKYEDPGRIDTAGVENLRADLGIRPDEAEHGIRQHGPPELCRRGVLRRRGSLPELHRLRQHQERLGAECHRPAFRQQHGGDPARVEVDHRAGLCVARTGVTPDGRTAVHLRAAGTARARAALPLRQGPALVHDRPAVGQRQRVSRLPGHQPVFVERAARTVGRRARSTTTSRRRSPRGSGRTSPSDGRAPTRCSGTARETSSCRNRRRRRTTRSDTSGSTPSSSTSRCRTRRRTTAISSRSTGTSHRAVCISRSCANGLATRRFARLPQPVRSDP